MLIEALTAVAGTAGLAISVVARLKIRDRSYRRWLSATRRQFVVEWRVGREGVATVASRERWRADRAVAEGWLCWTDRDKLVGTQQAYYRWGQGGISA